MRTYAIGELDPLRNAASLGRGARGLLEDPHAAVATTHAVAARVIQAPLPAPVSSVWVDA